MFWHRIPRWTWPRERKLCSESEGPSKNLSRSFLRSVEVTGLMSGEAGNRAPNLFPPPTILASLLRLSLSKAPCKHHTDPSLTLTPHSITMPHAQKRYPPVSRFGSRLPPGGRQSRPLVRWEFLAKKEKKYVLYNFQSLLTYHRRLVRFVCTSSPQSVNSLYPLDKIPYKHNTEWILIISWELLVSPLLLPMCILMLPNRITILVIHSVLLTSCTADCDGTR